MSIERVDCVVIGAGVVGIAIARELALRGSEVVILEAATGIGSVTSSRNSEVIHAGIYYAPGSLKARLCVLGRRLLYEYCESRGVPHSRCGKLIVATSSAQRAVLEGLARRAATNGVNDLQRLDARMAQALEPELTCHAALLSPSTGIVDSHTLMHQLLGDAEANGSMLAVASEVVRGRAVDGVIELDVRSPDGETTLVARRVVNSAGLDAPRVAAVIRGLPLQYTPAPMFAKGNYFSLTGQSPFSRLVYPVPEPGGLGIHLTLDLSGQVRFGPDVQWLDVQSASQIDYEVEPDRADAFYGAIRRYWPGLQDGALQPSYAGVRPKVSRGSEADFVIQGPATHGVRGLINLYGIESPGLTASLAIARHVRGQLEDH